MNRPPLVSVVVPTLNRPEFLGEALASVAGQVDVDLADIEVVVVNDGGVAVDDVVDAARRGGLHVVLHDHPQRLGLPSARNTGLDRATGAWVAFLDDDDVFLPHHLATGLAALEADGADAVVTDCLVAHHRVDPARPVADVAQRWDLPFDPGLLEVCNLTPVHAVVLRRPSVRFTEDLTALEDWDFWLRLTRDHGYRVIRQPEATVVYHRVPSADAMVNSTLDDAEALARFGDLAAKVWRSHPASTARVARFRFCIAAMYWQGLTRLATGRSLRSSYFLDTVRVIVRAWQDPGRELGLLEDLFAAMHPEPEPADGHAA